MDHFAKMALATLVYYFVFTPVRNLFVSLTISNEYGPATNFVENKVPLGVPVDKAMDTSKDRASKCWLPSCTKTIGSGLLFASVPARF